MFIFEILLVGVEINIINYDNCTEEYCKILRKIFLKILLQSYFANL